MFEFLIKRAKSILYISLKFLLSILLICSIYWICVQFISKYCAPSGFYGFLITPFTMGSPFCSSAHKLLNNLSDIYLGFIFMSINPLYNMA